MQTKQRKPPVNNEDDELDATGKAIFDDIYAARDPRPCYRAMASLDYSIPEEAKPHFARQASWRAPIASFPLAVSAM